MKTLLPIITTTLLSGCLSIPSKPAPSHLIKMEAGSAVDLRTQLDAANMVSNSMERNGCRQTDTIYPELIEKSPDFKAGKGYVEKGRIAERWVAHGCDKQVPYIVTFTANKMNQGGSDITTYTEKTRGSPVIWGIVDSAPNVARMRSPEPIKAKQLFPGSILNVYSPDSEGWFVTGSASNGISFVKRGAGSSETYGAQAITFEIPPTAGSEEFVALVKQRIAAVNPPPRYQETASRYQYNENRDYPCVTVHIALNDSAAVTPSGIEQLKLQVVALYCRHPVQQHLAFFAAYSRRGKIAIADNQIETEAMSFIEGVSVSK